MTTKFEYWFPTVIAVHWLDDSVRDSTSSIIQNWISSGKHQDYLESCRDDNLTTSYFKWSNTLADLGLTDLKCQILLAAEKYCEHLGLVQPQDTLTVDSWINFFYPGQSEQQHNHYGNFLSGVYYVSAPEKSGNFRFYDPAAQKTMWRGQHLVSANSNFTNQTSGDYQAELGKLILFPSWLEHAVLANKSSETRISLAFNINKATQ